MLNTSLQQLGDRIGKGAFGAVYKGLDIQTGSFVAIKRVPRRQGLDEAQLKVRCLALYLLFAVLTVARRTRWICSRHSNTITL